MHCDCNKRLTVFLGGNFDLFLDGIDGGFCASNDRRFDIFSDGIEDCGDIPRSFVYSISFTGGEDLVFPTVYSQSQCTEYGKVCEHPR